LKVQLALRVALVGATAREEGYDMGEDISEVYFKEGEDTKERGHLWDDVVVEVRDRETMMRG
jgi:hypothetical protein